jgi:phosphatidylglycerophosphate synthase
LSVSRIPAALALLAVYRPDNATRASLALGLFCLVAASDLLDGHIARRRHVASEFGYLLDGLGDRAVHVTAYMVLVSTGILPPFLAWVLIFREIAQYAVRLAESDWHRSISPADRWTTKFYAFAVYGALCAELLRPLLGIHRPPDYYSAIVQLTLGAAALASYSRILPRLWRAWSEAVRG